MGLRAGSASKFSLGGFYAGIFCLAWSCTTSAESLSDNVSRLSGSASVFTGVTHTRRDQGASKSSSTEPDFGLSGQVGGRLESGANALTLLYGGTLQTAQETIGDEDTGNTSINGAARYTYFDPGSRVDFNLGHTISSVRNDTGFEVNPASYDTENTLNGGAGLSFYPGELTTLRFTAQAGHSFGDSSLDDQGSYTLGSELSRRLTERSTGGLNLHRSWSDESATDLTIDTAQLVYSLQLESGYFRVGAGGSKAETEYTDGTVTENEAITGYIERSWIATNWSTAVKYDRRMSDSATDLSLNSTPDFSFLPETVLLRDLVVEDSLLFTHTNYRQACDACDLRVYARGAILESQVSGDTTHEYRAGADLGIQLTSLQRLSFGFSWEADAGEDASDIVDQVHRLNTSWTRQIAERTTFGVEFNQSYVSSKAGINDGDQFELLFVLSRGFSMTGARQ